MSTLSQFTGSRSVASIVNAFSSGGASLASVSAYVLNYGKSYATSALGANVLRDVLNISGRGAINMVGVHTTDATSKTLRLKVTVDGTVIFDATSGTLNGSGYGFIAIGAASTYSTVLQPIVFRTSCLVEMASSVASDTAATTTINYEVDL